MPSQRYNILTDTQVAHFLDRGFVILQDCFPPEFAAEWRDFAFKRLGYDPDRPETWAADYIHLPGMNEVEVRTFSPKAWGAICDLLGGEDRVANPQTKWRDGFVINFSRGADKPWIPPGPDSGGWHKDGDWFRHFLNGPEQGLLTIVVWSDIEHQGGGTFIACDSVKHVARMLAEHPEGLLPSTPFGTLAHRCTDFTEITGRVGDVVLHHPFMLHAASYNHSGRPRFITNPPVSLKEPMNFNREHPEDHSPVERCILKALGVERYEFVQNHPFERIVPEREHIQARMREEQLARLGQKK